MAKLSANGTEVYRLEKAVRIDSLTGTHYQLISIRSNGVALRARRVITPAHVTTSRWTVLLTRKAAHLLGLKTPQLVRDHFRARGFVEEV